MKKKWFLLLLVCCLVLISCQSKVSERTGHDYIYYAISGWGDENDADEVGSYRFLADEEFKAEKISDEIFLRLAFRPGADLINYSVFDPVEYDFVLSSSKADGTERVTVKSPNYGFRHTLWSPDGQHLAYVMETGSGGTLCFDPDSSNNWCLNQINGYKFVCGEFVGECVNDFDQLYFPNVYSWGKDSKTLLINASMHHERDDHSTIFKLFLLSLDFNVKSVAEIKYLGQVQAAKLSPDGERIIFADLDFHDTPTLMRSDGSEIKEVYSGNFLSSNSGTDIDWSPDGSQVFYLGFDGLTVIKADGTYPRLFGNRYDRVDGAFWSPDGSKIVYLGTHLGYINGQRLSDYYDIIILDPVTGDEIYVERIELTYPYWVTLTGWARIP